MENVMFFETIIQPKGYLSFITDKENVLFIPTKDFIVLFSMEKSNEFISKLKQLTLQ